MVDKFIIKINSYISYLIGISIIIERIIYYAT